MNNKYGSGQHHNKFHEGGMHGGGAGHHNHHHDKGNNTGTNNTTNSALQSGQGAQRNKFMDKKRGGGMIGGNASGSREDLNVPLDALIDRDKGQLGAGFKRQRRENEGQMGAGTS